MTEDEVWKYALSFDAYKWVAQMHQEGKLEPILSKESKEWLNQHIPSWREKDNKHNILPLAACVGNNKDISECSVEEIKTALFMEQRSNRWENEYQKSSVEYAKKLIEYINNGS